MQKVRYAFMLTMCAAIMMGVVGPTFAVIHFSESFDYPTGNNINGLGGWTTTIPNAPITVQPGSYEYLGYQTYGGGHAEIDDCCRGNAQHAGPQSALDDLFSTDGEFWISFLTQQSYKPWGGSLGIGPGGHGDGGVVAGHTSYGYRAQILLLDGGEPYEFLPIFTSNPVAQAALTLDPVTEQGGDGTPKFPVPVDSQAGTALGGDNLEQTGLTVQGIGFSSNNASTELTVIRVVIDTDGDEVVDFWRSPDLVQPLGGPGDAVNPSYRLEGDLSGETGYLVQINSVHLNGGPRYDEIRIADTFAEIIGSTDLPTDFTWSKNSLGRWTDSSSWLPPIVPNSPNHIAAFESAATGPTAAVVHSAVTVNCVTFDSANQYIVLGAGSVNFAATTAPSPTGPTLNVVSGNHQFQAMVNLLNNTTVDIASGASLSFNNDLNLTGRTLIKTGGGTLAINNKLTTGDGSVNIVQGTVSGDGAIGGDVTNGGGTISPGSSPGSQSVVPEPVALLLLGLGALVVMSVCRPKRKFVTSCAGALALAWSGGFWEPAAEAGSLAVESYSFEKPSMDDRTAFPVFYATPPSGWVKTEGNHTFGVYNPSDRHSFADSDDLDPLYSGTLPNMDGVQVAFLVGGNADTTVEQTIAGIVVENNKTYTLTMAIGKRSPGRQWTRSWDNTGTADVSLVVGDTVASTISANSADIEPGAFEDFTTIFTTGLDDPRSGQPLSIRFTNRTGGGNADFDNVRLDATTVGGDPIITDFSWTKNDLGIWTDSVSWNPQTVPNNPNHTAKFGSAATGPTAAVVHSAVTVNRIIFDNANQYIIGGGGSVNLEATTSASPEDPTLNVVSGNHQFQAIVNLVNNATADIASGSTLSFNNELNLTGQTLTKTGEGTLAISNKLTTAGGSVNVLQGIVSGVGTIGGDVNNGGGTISPGKSVGTQSMVPEPGAAMLMAIGLLWGPVLLRRMSGGSRLGMRNSCPRL